MCKQKQIGFYYKFIITHYNNINSLLKVVILKLYLQIFNLLLLFYFTYLYYFHLLL